MNFYDEENQAKVLESFLASSPHGYESGVPVSFVQAKNGAIYATYSIKSAEEDSIWDISTKAPTSLGTDSILFGSLPWIGEDVR